MKNILSISRLKFSLLLFAGGTISGTLNTLVVVSTALANNEKVHFFHPLLWELTGSYSFTLLIPVMIILFKKLPLKKGFLFERIPVYIIVSFAMGFIHTNVMYYLRILLYELLNWGVYDYGYMPYRYVMETLKLCLGFWTVYVIYILIMTSKERQQEKLRAVKLEEELIKTRLEFLKSQINPHFLFNTLNMISSTMYENVENADKMIANLSDLLRISLKSSGGMHTLKEEMDLLNLYLEIMRARFGDKLSININLKDDAKRFFVPSFLLQPVVENSIKYGMENLSGTEIEISARRFEDKLCINISDNGPGINIEPEEVLKRGVGLSNTQERLERLYGNRFEFNWENLPGKGLIVKFCLPVKEEKK